MTYDFGNGITISVELSEQDGLPVVQIDTGDETPMNEDGSPKIRVHINDCCISNDTPFKDGKVGW